MSELRIVRGNTFWTKTTVTAKDYEGTVIDDFDLSQSTDVVVIIRTAYRNIVMTEWSITGNDLEIKWKDIPTGRYGLDVSGIYDGIEWRFYTENVLDIVNSNAQANIPADTIIREDFYAIDGVTMMVTQIGGGGGNVQSDWEEEDSTNAAYIKNKPTIPSIEGLITQEDADARYAQISDIPTNVSQLTNDAGYLTSHQSLEGYATETWVGQQGYLTSFTETDPTVPSWAKQANKPTYTAQEVGALPSSTPIPSALSELSDDTTHRVVTDTEKSTWNGKSDFSGNYNDLSNKPTIPTVPTNVSAFTNDAGYLTPNSISNKANKIAIVNYGTSSTTTTLSENIYYIWGEVASLTLTLGTPADASKLSEYMFEFQSGATPTTLSLPSSVKWVETPTIEANKTYQVSIVNDIAIIVGV